MVDTIQGNFVFLEAKKTSKKKIFIWWKRDCSKISYNVVHLFIDVVIIETLFDLSLPIGSESIETHTLANNENYLMNG